MNEAESWLTLGIRVGEKRTFEGEQLRELGLEPDAEPAPPVTLRVVDVSENTITVQSMSEKIEPALSESRWQQLRSGVATHADVLTMSLIASGSFPEWAKLIAIANDALPDSDRRKITRLRIFLLRHALALAAGDMGGNESADYLAVDAFIDALESYLPPATATA